MTAWVRSIRQGHFADIPIFRWNDSAEIAHAFNGYRVAGDTGECAEVAKRVKGDYPNGFRSKDALDLWIALFWNHRMYRHTGCEPSGAELVYLDTLCVALRDRLRKMPGSERDLLMERIKDHLIPEPLADGES